MLTPPSSSRSFFFFFNDTATTEIYTLSLHDALPIYLQGLLDTLSDLIGNMQANQTHAQLTTVASKHLANLDRSEERTSELQSQSNLVCRLLLEKKKKKTI